MSYKQDEGKMKSVKMAPPPSGIISQFLTEYNYYCSSTKDFN